MPSEEVTKLIDDLLAARFSSMRRVHQEARQRLETAITALERERDEWKARAEKAEAERDNVKSWIEYHKEQYEALRLEIDCLNAAMKEGEEAEKELGKEKPCQDQ